jgi:hypothetical protein
MTEPTRAFISYSHRDDEFRHQLLAHLAPLRQSGSMVEWHDRKLEPGDDWNASIDERLGAASLFLLLVSADFLASDYCQTVELKRALQRQRRGEVRVIPVIVRACDWRQTELGKLQALPARGRAIASSAHPDEAWTEVVQGVSRILEAMRQSEFAARNVPQYLNEQTRALSLALEAARQRKQNLCEAGVDTTGVDAEILDLRRKLREGGTLKPGDSLRDGQFLLLNPIGNGGFSVVWKALDRESGEHVAIKVLHSQLAAEPSRRERFFRGARVMAALEHDAVVRIIEPFGEDGGYCYFVMELLTGGDFQSAILERKLSRDDAIDIVLRVGEALSFAHERSYFHRDVKPANILLEADGQAKLTDFDLVAASDSTGGTRTGALGTFAYLAPEIADKPQDANAGTDTYSLAMTAMFGLLGGMRLQDIYNRSAMLESLDCSQPVKDVLRRAISLFVQKRYQNVGDFCQELRQAWARDARGQNLAGGVLQAQNFDGKDFTGADLCKIEAEGASMRGAKLLGAALREARLENADLTDADLTQADLLGANLLGAKLAGAKLGGANVIGAMFDEGALGTCDLGSGLIGATAPLRVRCAAGPDCLSVVFSADGAMLGTAHSNGAVRVWDVARALCTSRFFAAKSLIWQLAFNPRGDQIAVVAWDETVSICPLPEGAPRVIGRGAWAVAFSADGALIASGSNENVVRLWRVDTGEEVATLVGHQATVRSVAFSSDNEWLATGSDDDTVHVWRLATLQLCHVLRPFREQRGPSNGSGASFEDDAPAPRSLRSVFVAQNKAGAWRTLLRMRYPVRAVAFSPDGKRLAAAWDEGNIRLFESATGREIAALACHQDWIRSIAFSPTNHRIASAADDHSVRLWDGAERSTELVSSKPVASLAFHPNGAVLACALREGDVELIDAESGTVLATLGCSGRSWAAFTPDGRYKVPDEPDDVLRFHVDRWEFKPGELDPYLPQLARIPLEAPFSLVPRASRPSPSRH